MQLQHFCCVVSCRKFFLNLVIAGGFILVFTNTVYINDKKRIVSEDAVKHTSPRPPNIDINSLIESSRKCLERQFKPLSDEMVFADYSRIVKNCSVQGPLRMASYRNRGEIKYMMRPSLGDENPFRKECTIVTLGIGKDVDAETLMKEDYPDCEFHGADPVRVENEKLYGKIGYYYEAAVGAYSSMIETNILREGYKRENITTVGLSTFLMRNIRSRVIDNILIDVESAEYEMLPLLLRQNKYKGPLGRYQICQFNMEVHGNVPRELIQKFGSLVKEAVSEWETIPIYSLDGAGHRRTIWINYAHPECRKRFINGK